jgi:hypothetical protein
MKKKIFYIFSYKFNEKYYEEFQIKFISKNFDLYIIDISYLFNKFLDLDIGYYNKKLSNFYIIKKERILLKLLKNSKCDIVALIGDEKFKNYIGNLLRKNFEIKIVEFYLSTVPDEYYSFNSYFKTQIYLRLLKYYFINDIIIKIILYIKRKIINFFIFEKKYYPDLVFCAGKEQLEALKKFKKPKKIISTHSFDFDKKVNDKSFFLEKKNIVFYDSMIMHHRDYRRNDVKIPVTQTYFTQLCKLFDYLEFRFKKKVVIALHPRCNIIYYKKFFNNRPCYKNLTYQISKKADFILTKPDTTAIAFPIILKKPMLFIVSEDFNKSLTHFIRLLIRKIFFKQPIINIDKDNTYKLIKNYRYLDSVGYSNYFIKFIKCDSRIVAHKIIFVEQIKKICQI